MDVKMYKIMDGERIQASMPANSVDRAMRKGWILEESAQKLEMPAEIIEIMKAKAEPTKEVEQIKVVEVETPKYEPDESVTEEPTTDQKKPMGRPKRK